MHTFAKTCASWVTDLARVYGDIPYKHKFINFTFQDGYSIYNQPNDFTKYIYEFELYYALPTEKPDGDPSIEL